jgi:hypothetical protein
MGSDTAAMARVNNAVDLHGGSVTSVSNQRQGICVAVKLR